MADPTITIGFNDGTLYEMPASDLLPSEALGAAVAKLIDKKRTGEI